MYKQKYLETKSNNLIKYAGGLDLAYSLLVDLQSAF